MNPVKDDLITTEEVFRLFPCLVTRFNWNFTTCGQLHAQGLLLGKYYRGKRMLLISKSSLLRLISIYKQDMDSTRGLLG